MNDTAPQGGNVATPPVFTAKIRKQLLALEKEAERCERRARMFEARAKGYRDEALRIVKAHRPA